MLLNEEFRGVRRDKKENLRICEYKDGEAGYPSCCRNGHLWNSRRARPVLLAFLDEVNKRNLNNVIVTQTGCIGVCRLEPMVEIYTPGEEKVTYVKVTPDKVSKIVSNHIVNGQIVSEYTIGAYEEEER